MFLVLVTIFSIVCSIPFGISLVYFIMGIKSCLTGRKEKSRQKIAGGVNAIFLASLGMLLCFGCWYWLCNELHS